MGLRLAFFSLVMTVSCLIGYIIIDPLEWLTDLFQQIHIDNPNHQPINTPLLQTTYLSINNKNKYFESNKIHNNVNDKMDFNLNNNTIPINKIHNQWQLLFYDIFIKFEFLPSFQNTPYQIHTNTFNLTNNIIIFNQLLHTTHLFFIQSQQNIENKLFILTYHRQLISIRRNIMILYKYLLSKNTQNIIINTETYNLLIQHMFINIRITYKDIIQNDSKYNKYWYLIHVSKSAGTSICATQRDVRYTQLKKLGTNCNIPGHGVPIKNEDIGDLSCSELEYIRKTEDIEFIGSERPMTGYKISNKPILCNKYHYILPIRNPLRRIASTLSEYNWVKQYFPFQILIKYGEGKAGFDAYKYWQSHTNKLKCFQNLIVLNNNTYGSLRNTKDYADFMSYLFENKLELDDEVEVVWHNNYKCKKKSLLDDMERDLYKFDDMTYITWLGSDKKYAIKITEGFKHRSNVSLLRGYCSNTYTRWIGYERDILDSDSSYDAIFEKSYNINLTHWLNAIDFLMITDYVLPFKSMFEHEIFKFTLKDLWDFKPKPIRKRALQHEMSARMIRNKLIKKRIVMKRDEEIEDLEIKPRHRIKKRPYKYVGKGRKRRPIYVSKTRWRHSHIAFDDFDHVASGHLVNSWSEKEIEFIKSKNLLDIQLFEIAMWIADVDAIFYNYLPVEQNEQNEHEEMLVENESIEKLDDII